VSGPVVTIEGVAYPNVLVDSLTVEESVGQVGRLSARIEDLDGTLGGGYYVWGTLPDIKVVDADGYTAFRGQIIDRALDLEGVHRFVTIEAEDYNRLLSRSLVGHLQTATTAQADGTVIYSDGSANTDCGGASTGIDGDLVQKLVALYWQGPTLDTTTYVVSHVDADDPKMYFPMSDLRAVLERIAARVGTRLFWHIDADLRLHWGPPVPPPSAPAVDHRLARMLPESADIVRSPHDISETPDFVTTVPARVTARVGTASSVESVYVRGGTTEGSGLYTFGSNGGGMAYVDAPWSVYGSDRVTAGAMSFEADISGRLTATAVVTGYNGWHIGQTINVQSSVFGTTSPHSFRIASVRSSWLPDGNRVHTLTLGNAPYRSFAIEAMKWEETTTPAARWTVVVEDVAPAPGERQNVYCQITDPAGLPYPIEGVKVNWGIVVNGVTYTGTDASDTAHMFYLDAEPSWGWLTDPSGRTYNNVWAHASATSADTCYLTVEAPLA
jgi:hypothetical protein